MASSPFLSGPTVPSVSLKLKYASTTFVIVVVAVAAVTAVLAWQHDVGTRLLGNVAENTAQDRVAVELRARAGATAEHAAEVVTSAVRAPIRAAELAASQPA